MTGMFPWNIARSAEGMFSRWAIGHICKFLLKKKLGQFIQGDLDLEQLDVQLGAGTIQLHDLALNVDYINQKLGVGLVIVKEGSIGSLLVKIPWRIQSCEIEVEELEIVLAPCRENYSPEGSGDSMLSQGSKPSVSCSGSDKIEREMVPGDAGSVCLDVHEGVKTIAKTVKLLLSSFHVKIKKLIVAFDPCPEKGTQSHRTLVLRITETEYGTCISEDAKTHSDLRDESFLGMTRLTNFVKFQGATVELLQMDEAERQSSASGTVFNERYRGTSPSSASMSIITGDSGGFSGTLKLSIPWKSGSLDIHKMDADLSVDPMELRFQPNTINWIVCLWESLTFVAKEGRSHMGNKATESVCPNCPLHCCATSAGCAVLAVDSLTQSSENSFASFCSQTNQEATTGILLPGAYFIPDWVPLCISKNQDGTEAEADYEASIDQFFECFDGMRSSQASLAGSAMWNWTCSVFTAITAASNLASGSVHIPLEQRHIETNLRATFAGISVVLSFHDEDQKHSSYTRSCDWNTRDLNGIKQKAVIPIQNGVTAGSTMSSPSYADEQSRDHPIHYLEAKLHDLALVLQICPQEVKFEGVIKNIEVDDYSNRDAAVGFSFSDCENNQTLFVQRLQEEVQASLPSFPSSFQDPASEETANMSGTGVASLSVSDSVPEMINGELLKVKLFRSLGETACHCAINSAYPEDKSMPLASFSVKLPPFILWMNFYLVNMLSNLLSRQAGNSLGTSNLNKDSDSKGRDSGKKHVSSCQKTCPYVCSPKGSLHGSIFLPHARIIFCFPSHNHGVYRSFSWEDDFIGIDFSPCLSVEKVRDGSYLEKGYSYTPSGSIHLSIGNANVYLITSSHKDAAVNNWCNKHVFSSQNIFSVTWGPDHSCFGITMLWQAGPVTGPWMAERAWSMATSEDSRRARHKVSEGKDVEFASVKTTEDVEGTNSCVRQEMILSSAFFLRIQLSHIWVKLCCSEYKLLHHLINQVVDGYSCTAHAANGVDQNEEGKSSPAGGTKLSQSSILLECDVVDVSIGFDKTGDIKHSLQKELAGSWDSVRLNIDRFEMLSVSNIGEIRNAEFFWASHSEGALRGSIIQEASSVASEDFLLICARNTAMHRGDGEGTNALSSGSAGTTIMHLCFPHLSQSFTSITVRCGTIVAPGGRLDWLSLIPSFFSMPSSSDCAEEDDDDDASFEKTFFLLELVDVALSYEPPLKRKNPPKVNKGGFLESERAEPVEESSEQQHVTCLVAAASLYLSNQTVANAAPSHYIIKLQDVGLLCASSSVAETDGHAYGAEYLRSNGYVKVVGETLVEAVLRTNCKDFPRWELEVSDCHFGLDTCHDTTAGLIRLAAQLQQLFAPDIEESVMHLQTRWNSVKQASDGHEKLDKAISPSVFCSHGDNQTGTSLETGLMDEILEDAFHLGRNLANVSLGRDISEDHTSNVSNSSATFNAALPQNFTFSRSIPGSRPENIPTSRFPQEPCIPEFIEDYCISDLLPSTASKKASSKEVPTRKTNSESHGDESGKCGWYEECSLSILENHISRVSDRPGQRELREDGFPASINSALPGEPCKAKGRIRFKNIDVRWRMYAGSDWSISRKNAPPFVSNVGGRDVTVCLELALSGINIRYDMFPDGEICVSKFLLSVQDFYLYDCSRDAPWKKVLGCYHSKDLPREFHAKSLKLDLEAIRPDPFTPLEEYRLRLALLPLRLHLDQGQLDFLVSFFAQKGSSADSCPSPSDLGGRNMPSSRDSSCSGQNITDEALLPFFQQCDIGPVVVRVDYIPRHIDLVALRGGNYAELLNLVPWKGIELQLKHVHAVGIYGWNNVFEAIVGEWLVDISHNQVPKLLKGLPPLRSLLAVGSGAAKLVSLPVKNYRKDHKLLKGVQRGAFAFIRSISLEAVGLGLHLAAGAHDILLQTEYILTSIPPSIPLPLRSKVESSLRSNQPDDAQQGIQQAYESLGHGIGRTASALVGNPLKSYQRGAGAGSALASAVRAAPAAAIAPVSSAACAMHCALLGVRNSLNPELKKESIEKYSGRSSRPQDRRKKMSEC